MARGPWTATSAADRFGQVAILIEAFDSTNELARVVGSVAHTCNSSAVALLEQSWNGQKIVCILFMNRYIPTMSQMITLIGNHQIYPFLRGAHGQCSRTTPLLAIVYQRVFPWYLSIKDSYCTCLIMINHLIWFPLQDPRRPWVNKSSLVCKTRRCLARVMLSWYYSPCNFWPKY